MVSDFSVFFSTSDNVLFYLMIRLISIPLIIKGLTIFRVFMWKSIFKMCRLIFSGNL